MERKTEEGGGWAMEATLHSNFPRVTSGQEVQIKAWFMLLAAHLAVSCTLWRIYCYLTYRENVEPR